MTQLKSRTVLDPENDSVLVAYDPKNQTVVELWSVDGTLIAELPSGERHTGDIANEILKSIVQADRILTRKVQPANAKQRYTSPCGKNL